MRETSGLFIIEVKRRVKNNKELVWILVIVIFLAAAVFLPKGITGFVSFSIYPSEPTGSDTSNEIGIQPIDEPSTQQSSDEGFGIMPVENLTIEIKEETFEILPENESSELDNFFLMNYINKSDGFSIATIGLNAPFGIATNGSDFWITDPGDTGGDNFVYHTDRYGNNITDGFNTLTIGSGTPYGITTNDSDFWIVDMADMFIYHTDRLGNNITDGFSTSASAGIGADNPWSITTNGSDFWILDTSDTFVYHTDRYGNNISDGFCISAICGVGADTARSITTNGSDFWIVDSAPLGGDSFVYHTDRNGNNITDGFSTLDLSPNILNDITTNNTDFWIVDATNLFVYHVANNVTITNTAPVINLIYITSDDNTKNTTIVNLTGTFSVTDADGNNMILNETRWYNNSIEETGLRNQTNVSYINTTRLENWMFSARTYDGTAWSIWTNSSNFTILNTLPTISQIYITSDDNIKNNTIVNLTGTFTYVDIDNDLTTANETRWYNNSIEETGLRNQTNVSYINTTKNDNWMFSARAYDGANWSIWTNSSNFTILNAAPTHTNPLLFSTNNQTNDTNQNLTCYNQSTVDADGDNVKNIYNWYKNNASIMVLNMPFEGGSNSTYTKDYSSYGNNGVVSQATYGSNFGYDGKGAYNFDSGGVYFINISNPTQLQFNESNNFAIEAWFYHTLPASPIISKIDATYGGYSLFWDTDNKLKAYFGSSTTNAFVNSTSTLSDDIWYHAVVSINNKNASLYINGVYNNSNNFTYLNSSAGFFYIGYGRDYPSKEVGSWGGKIDEVRIYNYSLSANQILALYQNKTNFIHSDGTSAGNFWKCSVIPNDGTSDGSSLNSSELQILNTLPTISSIYITSDDNTKNTTIVNLTGTFTYVDIDNDLTTANETRWYNNSIEITSLKNFTLILADNTTKNDNWMFSARAYDGTDWSVWTNSSNFTILNAAPVVYLRTPENNSVSTTQLTTFIYNVTDADGNEVDNCTLWIENSTGLAIGGINTSITIDQNISIYVTLPYETINWSVGCTDISNGKANSTKWIYTVNQPAVEQVGGTGGPSHGRAQITPEEMIPEVPEQPPAPEPEVPEPSIEMPSAVTGPYKEEVQPFYYEYLTYLYLLGIIVAIFLIIKEIKYLRKSKFKHKIKLAKVKEKKDYIIVKHKFIDLLPKFNKLVITVLEQIRERQYNKIRNNYRKLMSLYNKIVIDNKRKDALNILLKEINNKIELAVLKKDVNKEIKEHKVISLGENEELNELHKLIENRELRTFKFKKENYKAEIPKIKSERIEKKIHKKKVLSEEEKRLNEVHRLIKEGKHIEARKLLR